MTKCRMLRNRLLIMAPISIFGAGCIEVTNRASYEVVQRDSGGTANIALEGTYVELMGVAGYPGAIVAQFGANPAQVIDPQPAGGSWSGTLTDQPEGQGTLRVWMEFGSSDLSTVEIEHFGIGDVFLLAPCQSNCYGFGDNLQVSSHPILKAGAYSFGNPGGWGPSQDPMWRSDHLHGSPWPLVATHIMASQGIPVAFVHTYLFPVPMGEHPSYPGVGWDPGLPGNVVLPWVSSAIEGALRLGEGEDACGGFRAALMLQGESDALLDLGYATYKDALLRVGDLMAEDYCVPLILAATGRVPALNEPAAQEIRLAQTDAVIEHPNLFGAFPLVDVTGPNVIHFTTDVELDEVASRFFDALCASIYDCD